MGAERLLPKNGNVTWSEVRLIIYVGTIIATIIFSYTSLNEKVALILNQQKDNTANIKDLDSTTGTMKTDIAVIKQIIADNKATGKLSKSNSDKDTISFIPLTLGESKPKTAAPSAMPNDITYNYINPTPVPTPEKAAPSPTPISPTPTPTPSSRVPSVLPTIIIPLRI